MMPEFEGEESKDPFDIQEGMNFKLAIRRVEDFPNYDLCTFEPQSALCDGDVAKQKAILAKCHDLSELVDPSLFKSFDELEAKYFKAIGVGKPRAAEDEGDEAPASKTTVRKEPPKHVEEDMEDVNLDDVMNG